MFRLIETIRLENGEFSNLAYHARRMSRAWKEFFGSDELPRLDEILATYSRPSAGLYKCRLTYNNKMNTAEFKPYAARTVNSLKIVRDDDLSYDHKFEDRQRIDAIFTRREGCDDVLIVKRGRITDTSIANIIFRKGNTWITPSSCLLAGTMRQNLLDRKMINEDEITVADLRKFDAFKPVNAMVLFDAPESAIENIRL